MVTATGDRTAPFGGGVNTVKCCEINGFEVNALVHFPITRDAIPARSVSITFRLAGAASIAAGTQLRGRFWLLLVLLVRVDVAWSSGGGSSIAGSHESAHSVLGVRSTVTRGESEENEGR